MDLQKGKEAGPGALAIVAGVIVLMMAEQGLLAACTSPPLGQVSWWTGEGNAFDAQGTNNGTFTSPTYAVGEVGQAFSFDGSGNNVRVPASPTMDVGAGPGMTIEAWIYSTDNSSPRPIVEWVPKAVGAFGAHFYVNQGGPGALYANLYDTANNSHTLQTITGLIPTGTYQHVAVTYDRATGIGRLFINGSLAVESVLGSFSPQTAPDLVIGYRPNTVPFGPISFIGRIDEVSLYSRALTTNELQAIYAAGSAGKCYSAPPSIVSQPTNQTAIAGSSVSFSVTASGSQPLSFQWTMDGTNLPGATNGALTLSNVQAANAGSYAVTVTNRLGSMISSNAVLAVIQPSCATTPSDLVSWWPAEGSAADVAGTNNGMLFSGAAFDFGEVGEGFTFNGSSYVEIPDNPSLNLTNAFTIELWYKDTGLASSGYAGLVAKRPYSGPCTFGISITGGNAGSFLAYFLDPNYGSYQGATYSPLPSAGSWHHLAASYRQVTTEQIEIKNFIDGQLVKTTTLAGNLSRTLNNYPVYIGCSNPPGGEYFTGNIDEVSIYSRALSDSEIAAIFNAGSLGKCLPPSPPSIFSQPTNATVVAGSTVNLTVGAIGTQPLRYQWTMNATNVVGATNMVLTLTNVQPSQSGSYAVEVTNSYGFAVSSNAVVKINPPPPCTVPATGLISWWAGDGNAADKNGANDGVFSGASYSDGKVGKAFNFEGSGNNIRVPASFSLDVGAGNGMTIEAWVLSPDSSSGRPIVEWVPKTIGAFGTHFYAHAGGPGVLYANLYDTANNSHIIQTPPGIIAVNAYQHVAVTYDKGSGVARLYLNGTQVVQASLGTFTPQTTPDFSIGYRPDTVPFGPIPFVGKIDEVSLYSRALEPSEIQAVYDAGGAGKCNVPVAPSIFVHPTSQTLTVGQTANFRIQAGGSSPLTYQWSFKGGTISGATNAGLVLTNVQMNQAGDFSVQVTNAYGSITSSNAALVVNFPPASVKVAAAAGTAGGTVRVPIVLVANGNENGLGFSLNYPPALLTNTSVTLGPGATGGFLQFNTNQPGTVGVVIALQSGVTFTPGTQQVAEIGFTAAVSAKPFSVPLTFGDQPTASLLSDISAHPLAANFTGGQVQLARSAFEADVAPRPDGDGTVTVVDWVQVGRYVAGLDTPADGAEFQRADCAPRNTLGDGGLTVSDWVQAGRYAAGLDQVPVSGGPTTPAVGAVVGFPARKRGSGPERAVMVEGPLIFQGQTGAAIVSLAAQGNENAVGVSLAFDPAVVAYVNASAGSDMPSGAAMDINPNQATNGHVGIILSLPVGISFNSGTRELVKVSFQATTAGSVNSTIALSDLPVRREVADTNAFPVAASYVDGTIALNPKPALGINQGKQSLSLAWPLWATNYALQQAASPALSSTTWSNALVSAVITNGAFTATVPVGGTTEFYRLKKQ